MTLCNVPTQSPQPPPTVCQGQPAARCRSPHTISPLGYPAPSLPLTRLSHNTHQPAATYSTSATTSTITSAPATATATATTTAHRCAPGPQAARCRSPHTKSPFGYPALSLPLIGLSHNTLPASRHPLNLRYHLYHYKRTRNRNHNCPSLCAKAPSSSMSKPPHHISAWIPRSVAAGHQI